MTQMGLGELRGRHGWRSVVVWSKWRFGSTCLASGFYPAFQTGATATAARYGCIKASLTWQGRHFGAAFKAEQNILARLNQSRHRHGLQTLESSEFFWISGRFLTGTFTRTRGGADAYDVVIPYKRTFLSVILNYAVCGEGTAAGHVPGGPGRILRCPSIRPGSLAPPRTGPGDAGLDGGIPPGCSLRLLVASRAMRMQQPAPP